MHEVRIFPKVTTSKQDLIKHIKNVCAIDNIDKEIEKEWIEHIEIYNAGGHYFLNLIYIKFISAYLILHEYSHHISQQLNTLTNSKSFWFIDDLADKLYLLLYKIPYRILCVFDEK